TGRTPSPAWASCRPTSPSTTTRRCASCGSVEGSEEESYPCPRPLILKCAHRSTKPHLDGWCPNVRIGRRRVVVPVLVTLGVREDGERVILDMRMAGEESAAAGGKSLR